MVKKKPKGFTENHPEILKAINALKDFGFTIEEMDVSPDGFIREIRFELAKDEHQYVFTFEFPTYRSPTSQAGSIGWIISAGHFPEGWKSEKCFFLYKATSILAFFNKKMPHHNKPVDQW